MSAKSDIINRGVDRTFAPVDAVRAVRRQIFVTIGTGLLMLAAVASSGLFALALWAWVAYRGFTLALLLAVGSEMIAERERRINALPPGWRAHLRGEDRSEAVR